MQIKQKLLIGFLLISLLIFGFTFGINLLLQNKTFAIFQEVGGELLPGDIALSRMSTELYHTALLLEKYKKKSDVHILKEIDKSIVSLDAYKTTHDLYHGDDELTHQIESLIQAFSREVARYKLLLQKDSDKEDVLAARKRINILLEEFTRSLNPAIEKSIETSYQKITDVHKMNQTSQNVFLIGGALILILIFFLSMYTAHLFSEPLRILRDATRQIGAGNLDIKLSVNSKDEVGDLAQAFNKMVDDLKTTQLQLKKKNQALKKHQEHLEDMVDARTIELQCSNDTLQNTIEELNQTQAQLIETEKMASLGGIVAGVAHEINTPLGICITAATSLEDDILQLNNSFQKDDMTEEQFKDHLKRTENLCKILNTNLNTSAKLINSFKQVSIEPYYNDWRDINLFDLINENIHSMDTRLIEHKVSVENQCLDDLIIYSSLGILNQIISALISNSLTHAFDQKEGEKIIIRAKKNNNNISIEFQDNGKGINNEHKKLIFEPFFTTRRGDKENSGLGLSIIYNLISKTLNGTIKAQSELGKGTSFHIELPLIKNDLH